MDSLKPTPNDTTIQNRTMPVSRRCFIYECANETLIQIPENCHSDTDLCALACVSKRFCEVAQHVLYQVVHLKECDYLLDMGHHLENPSMITESKIARFLWTISQMPYLASKVKSRVVVSSRNDQVLHPVFEPLVLHGSD